MRRRMMLGRKSELPAGYRRCEYLESTGTQYILIPQIDITDKPLVKFEVIYQTYNKDARSFGSIMRTVRFENGIGWQGESFSYNFGNGYGMKLAYVIDNNGVKKEVPASSLANKHLTFEYKDSLFYLNGIKQTIARYAVGDFGVARNVIVFGTNREGKIDLSNVKICNFYVYGQINLIPALDPSGRPCMYDTVTKQPFYNQGTGEFLYELSGGGILSKLIRRLRRLGGGSL